MVQRDINIGMNMHAMIQVLCVVWVPCVLFVQIQHPLKLAGSFFFVVIVIPHKALSSSC